MLIAVKKDMAHANTYTVAANFIGSYRIFVA